MNLTLLKAVIRARRTGLLHLKPADRPLRLDCLMSDCVKCCRNLGSPVVTAAEACKIDADFLEKSGDSVFIKSQNCACCLLKEGLCSIYARRPRGCAEYPWYNIDGRLYYDAGCPGIRDDRDERPDVAQIQPFENFFPNMPAAPLWVIRKICLAK
jgi:Fe-S-cluster containining protein